MCRTELLCIPLPSWLRPPPLTLPAALAQEVGGGSAQTSPALLPTGGHPLDTPHRAQELPAGLSHSISMYPLHLSQET